MSTAKLTDSWPRLSEAIGPIDPCHCQACGDSGNDRTLDYWVEHDAEDRPTRVVVALCPKCSGRLIEPHPRLYSRVPRFEPRPGIMSFCADCTERQGMSCNSPLARANGGPGMAVYSPRPSVAFVDGVRGGRRVGWQEKFYPGPATKCDGRISSVEQDETGGLS